MHWEHRRDFHYRAKQDWAGLTEREFGHRKKRLDTSWVSVNCVSCFQALEPNLSYSKQKEKFYWKDIGTLHNS